MAVKNYIKWSSKQPLWLLSIFLGCLILASCKKSFLEQVQNPKVVATTGNDCQALLNNYSLMNSLYPNDGEISSDDYYTLPVNAVGNEEEQEFYRWEPNAQRIAHSFAWSQPYGIINTANVVLETLAVNPGSLDQTTINTIKGEALFFRANMFYQLAQLYTKPYDPATAGQDLGIPVRTSPDIEVKSTRGTVSQTFAQIITDLKEAVTLLPTTSSILGMPVRAAAYTALARAYLSMQDFTNAGICSNASLNIYNTLLNYNSLNQASNTPFTRFNAEVLFQSVLFSSLIEGPTLNGLVDTTLYRSYANNDLRKYLFFRANATGAVIFKGNYNQRTAATFFSGEATDETYLIRAECYARQGNTTAALADLNTLLTTRWKTGTYVDFTATSADDALQIILTERRKELCFRGIRWADLRRLNKDPRFAKTLTRNINGTIYTLPPNDIRYALLLPLEALQYNTLQQNPR